MDVKDFVNILGADFFAGVPDSKLRPFVDYLVETYGSNNASHVIAANEGNAAALAAGYHLATGKTPVVYLQNSGLGNIVNPLLSLLDRTVYGIPCIFVIGWRGEPGLHDEPQHLLQGRLTPALLDTMGVTTGILTRETTPAELARMMGEVRPHLAAGGQAAFLVREGALTYPKQKYENLFPMRREDAVAEILNSAGDAVIVATTGKTGRELFELREARGEGHASDFLTVGSMGHASAIALGIALHRPPRRVICIDGDGAALMHMGAMATIGAIAPENLVHILLNNEAHESVGGAPTVADSMNFLHIAEAVGYRRVRSADDPGSLRRALQDIQEHRKLTFLEVRIAIGSRSELGRPTTTPAENKAALMRAMH